VPVEVDDEDDEGDVVEVEDDEDDEDDDGGGGGTLVGVRTPPGGVTIGLPGWTGLNATGFGT
jgi:hypothetical protein